MCWATIPATQEKTAASTTYASASSGMDLWAFRRPPDITRPGRRRKLRALPFTAGIQAAAGNKLRHAPPQWSRRCRRPARAASLVPQPLPRPTVATLQVTLHGVGFRGDAPADPDQYCYPLLQEIP